jgi:hypothetical protein
MAGTFSDDFDDGDLAGWKCNMAFGVSVVEGELCFKSKDPLVAKIGEPLWREYSLQAQMKIIEFVNGGWFSIRLMQGKTDDISGYYEIRISQEDILVSAYLNNRRVESFLIPTNIKESVWQNLVVEPADGAVSFFLDDIMIAQLNDWGLSGYVDMCSTKGTHVHVDNVIISGENVPNTGPSGLNSFASESRAKLKITWGEIKKLAIVYGSAHL